MVQQLSIRRRMASGALIGGLLAGAAVAGPVSAATLTPDQCAAASGRVSVRAVAISAGDTITLQATPPDGNYIGQGTAEVYCQGKGGANLGDIPDAQVTITINPTAPLKASQFIVTGDGVASPGNPVTIGPFTGSTTFTVTGASDILPPGVAAADVAVNIEVVTDAWGAPLIDPKTGRVLKTGTFGDVLAETPELDSLALLASGTIGLIGYATLRRRASRSRRD